MGRASWRGLATRTCGADLRGGAAWKELEGLWWGSTRAGGRARALTGLVARTDVALPPKGLGEPV